MLRRLIIVATVAFSLLAIMASATGEMQKPVYQTDVSSSDLIVWAQQTAVAMYTYDSSSYSQHLAQSVKYFTPEGWKNYLSTTANLQKPLVTAPRPLNVTAVINGKTKFKCQSIVNGKPIVKANQPVFVTVPLLVSYRTDNAVQHRRVIVTLKVVPRADTATALSPSAAGFAISQLVAKQHLA